MQSAKKMKALSVLSMAVAATMGAKAAHAATVTLYYDNINVLDPSATVVQSYNYGTAGGDQSQIPLTINVPVGDTFQFGVDAVVTNNVNPDAGKKTGSSATKDIVQPSFLGLATFSVVVPSTDTNASKLSPNTDGQPANNTFGTSPDFNASVSLNIARVSAVPPMHPPTVIPAAALSPNGPTPHQATSPPPAAPVETLAITSRSSRATDPSQAPLLWASTRSHNMVRPPPASAVRPISSTPCPIPRLQHPEIHCDSFSGY